MNAKIFLLGLSGLILTACASGPPKPVPQPQFDPEAGIVLAQAAKSVNHSLIQLDQIQQVATPAVNISTPPNPATIGLAIPGTLQWYGPPEPVIAKIASMANYQFRILGRPPAQPIIVRLNIENQDLAYILQNIGLQCKNQAIVVIFPNSKIIELRYEDKGSV